MKMKRSQLHVGKMLPVNSRYTPFDMVCLCCQNSPKTLLARSKICRKWKIFGRKHCCSQYTCLFFFNHFSYFRKLPTWCCNPITEFSFFPIFLSKVKNVVLSNTIEFSVWKHMLIFLFQNCWSLCPPWQKTPLSLLISWHLLKIYWRPFLLKNYTSAVSIMHLPHGMSTLPYTYFRHGNIWKFL